jgi:predicted transposase YbfD/YdcC
MKTLVEIFEKLEDPRDKRGKRHKLVDIIVMSIYAIICGNEDCENIADWLELRIYYFKELLKLENGIPCADTFLRVFRAIEPQKFMEMFAEWVRSIPVGEGKQIAIDGKAVKSAADRLNGGNTPYIVSAFLTEIGISIGQVKCDDKSNEITAIPELLEILDISGCVITIDAIGCQSKIVKKIVGKEGHYCLTVKENQSNLYKDIDEYFKFALNDRMESENLSYHLTKSFSHGRYEKRKYYVTDDETLINHINDRKKWKNLKAVGMVENTREIGGKTTVSRKYYILDIDVTAERFAEITRNHWQIENGLHWILDVHFKEDLSTSKKDNSIFNLSLLRKICYNLIKLDDSFNKSTKKISFKKKLNRYNFDFQLLNNLIFHVIPANF